LFGATHPEVSGGGFYGPQGIGEMSGPSGPAKVNSAGHMQDSADKLWRVSEELTDIVYSFPS
jgi:hypothetical protein